MCGRFALVANAQQVAEEFGVPAETIGPLAPRYNIAPSQPILVVREALAGGREATHCLWGLIPSWVKDVTTANRPINVRVETATEKPSFRNAFRRRRCLVPASGFYEWASAGGTKQPYFFRPADGRLLALGGLWEVWSGPNGEQLETCAIITIPANAAVKPIHDRMPAIIARQHYGEWLNRRLEDPKALVPLLSAPPDELLEAVRVSPLVNNPRNDGPECLQPL